MTTATHLGTTAHPITGASLRPLLIGGCPRSGTTLLGAMLGIGPTRVTVPESTFKLRLLPLAGTAGVLSGEAVTDQLRRDRLFRLWDIPAPELTGAISYPELLSRLVTTRAERDGKHAPELWIDHTPANIWRADALSRLLPDARFIHLIRDGRAVAASLLGLDWGPNTVADAASWWCSWVAHGLAAERSLGQERVLCVRYEELVTDPVVTLRRICDFAETPFDPAMVERRDYRVSAYTRGMHDLVDARPDEQRVDAWKQVLTPYEVSAFERRTGDLLALLGYPPVHGPAASLGPRSRRLRESLVDVARRGVTDRAKRAVRRRRLVG